MATPQHKLKGGRGGAAWGSLVACGTHPSKPESRLVTVTRNRARAGTSGSSTLRTNHYATRGGVSENAADGGGGGPGLPGRPAPSASVRRRTPPARRPAAGRGGSGGGWRGGGEGGEAAGELLRVGPVPLLHCRPQQPPLIKRRNGGRGRARERACERERREREREREQTREREAGGSERGRRLEGRRDRGRWTDKSR